MSFTPVGRPAPQPWHRQPAIWLSIAALLISLLSLFRDYLGIEIRRKDSSNTVETKPAMPESKPLSPASQ